VSSNHTQLYPFSFITEMATGGGSDLPALEQDDLVGVIHGSGSMVISSTSGKLKLAAKREREAKAKAEQLQQRAADAAAVLSIEKTLKASSGIGTAAAAKRVLSAVQPHLGLPAAPPVAVVQQPAGQGGAKPRRPKTVASTVPATAGSRAAKETGVAAKQLAREAEKEFRAANVSILRQLE